LDLASDSLSAAFTQLGTLLEAIVGVESVTLVPRSLAALPENEEPAVYIVEGPLSPDHFMTSRTDYTYQVGIQLLYSGSESTAQGIQELILDAVEGASSNHLSDTVQNIWVFDGEQPFNWPDTGQLKWRGIVIALLLKRDR
jgi:hypothetical protein